MVYKLKKHLYYVHAQVHKIIIHETRNNDINIMQLHKFCKQVTSQIYKAIDYPKHIVTAKRSV